MGFFNCLPSKRTATVGIANETDVGSLPHDAKHVPKPKTLPKLRKSVWKRTKTPKQPALEHPDDSSESSEQLSVYTNGVVHTTEASLHHVPNLVRELETAVVVGTKKPRLALERLLVLSNDPNRRLEMVQMDDGKLVPVLLSFLNRCMVQSKEHNLALLLLVNLSIPPENKRRIALDCKGVEILAKLLCEDPSCHLLALVLVHLTNTSTQASTFLESNMPAIEITRAETKCPDTNKINVIPGNPQHEVLSLHQELLKANDKTALVESLAFALRVASLTANEYKGRRKTIENCNFSDEYLSPATRLSILMAKDQQLRCSPEQDSRIMHRVLPATASPEQILKQLQSNEYEVKRWGSIDGTMIGARPAVSKRSSTPLYPPPMVQDNQQIYPKTAKWCLLALQNLTKPCHGDATAAHAMIKSGIFSLVVQCITTVGSNYHYKGQTTVNTLLNSGMADRIAKRGIMPLEDPALLSSTTINRQKFPFDSRPNVWSAFDGARNAPRPISDTGAVVQGGEDVMESNEKDLPPSLLGPIANSPYTWDSNSTQDAALSIVLNVSASCLSREYMYEPHIIKVLTIIAEYPRLMGKTRFNDLSTNDIETMEFQALKARMALSYLIGSQGHFGQAKLRSSASTIQANPIDSCLVMSDKNVELLVELLANTMNHRGKEGNGGGNYMAGTFDLKCIILSLRCLLTHTSNQEKVARLLGSELNTLLINALARYALEPSTSPIDLESSGDVAFSLYLLSNHCFENLPFLPEMYGAPKRQGSQQSYTKEKDHGLAANILVSYLRHSKIPPEGRHAAEQLLLRLNYLKFENSTAVSLDTTRPKTWRKVVRSADLKINYILLAKIKRVQIANRKHGHKPSPAIFRGRVLRSPKPREWEKNARNQKSIEWRNSSTIMTFANALMAVQQLSYGSNTTRNSSSIDDIAIANKIVHCANHEASAGCHNFLWAWEISKIDSTSSSDSDSLCETDSSISFGPSSLPRLICCSSTESDSFEL